MTYEPTVHQVLDRLLFKQEDAATAAPISRWSGSGSTAQLESWRMYYSDGPPHNEIEMHLKQQP
jgi:hypothetical protein